MQDNIQNIAHSIGNRMHYKSNQSPRHQRRRHGFTLVEMLVVISIILLLIGMSVAGFSQIAKHGKNTHTKIALETCKALLAEFEASAGKTEVATFRSNFSGFTVNAANWKNPLTTFGGVYPATTRTMSWEQYTANVIAKIASLPNAKSILAKLPADQYRSVKIRTSSGTEDVMLILDGYDRPILFCPSGGISNVKVSGDTSARTYSSDGLAHTAANPRPNPNPRPFWISVGPDNDPVQADDNITSVDQ